MLLALLMVKAEKWSLLLVFFVAILTFSDLSNGEHIIIAEVYNADKDTIGNFHCW